MKKEYLILTAVILILCAYLFLHKEDRDNYTLPEIPAVKTEAVTGIIIEKNSTPIEFFKNDDKWTVTDKKYPADKYSIDNILSTFKNFKLSTLVSQEGDLKRYELDESQKIQVTLKQKEKTVFEVAMGKTAPTFNHTFVMLAGDKNIYHGAGSFRSNFDKSAADFRDKTVLDVKKQSLKQFSIEKAGLQKTLVETGGEKDKESADTTWNFEDGEPADQEQVSDLLSALADLDCESYPEISVNDLTKELTPLYKIVLENDTHHELTLFENKADENLMGISSMNPYVFILSRYSAKEITENTDKLLGIYKAEDKKE